MKPGTESKQRRKRAIKHDASGIRLENAGKEPEQRRLARSIPPDDAEHFSVLHGKRDIAERLNGMLLLVFGKKKALNDSIFEGRGASMSDITECFADIHYANGIAHKYSPNESR